MSSRHRPIAPVMRGLSMVELMVAMAVGLLLLAGVLQVMLSSRATYRLAETQARVQENGRYAAQLLAADLRGSRSAGCRSVALEEYYRSLNVIACSLLSLTGLNTCAGESALGSELPLGYDSSQAGSAAWLTALAGSASSGAERNVRDRWLRGDVLVSWGTLGEGVYMAANDSLNDAQHGTVDLLSHHDDLQGGRLALVSDCVRSDVFAITNPRTNQGVELGKPSQLEFAVQYDSDGSPDPDAPGDPDHRDQPGTQVNSTATLSRSYNRHGTDISPGPTVRARVFPFEYRVFFVCCMDSTDGAIETGNAVRRCNADPDRYRPALCRWSTSTSGETRQLVADVADLRLTYDGNEGGRRFQDLTESPDAAWVAARRGGAGAWSAVDTVRVELLTTSAEQAMDAESQPPFLNPLPAGVSVPDDRRLYERFDVSAAIRANSPWYLR